APLNEFLTYSISNKHCEYAQPRRFPLPRVLKNHCAKQACRNGSHQRTPMLVKPISSTLFILASKRNRVRVGYEKVCFCAGVLFKAYSPPIHLKLTKWHQHSSKFHQPDLS